ncbi:hypothetical protein TNCV_2553221 [Trichonephila clavipes]|nr:hypothetical protein TNCV_2553221 [Trichonephila clavipes]
MLLVSNPLHSSLCALLPGNTCSPMDSIEQWYSRKPMAPETLTVKRALHCPFTDCTTGTIIQLDGGIVHKSTAETDLHYRSHLSFHRRVLHSGVIGDVLVGPYLLQKPLTSGDYLNFRKSCNQVYLTPYHNVFEVICVFMCWGTYPLRQMCS